MGCGVSVWLAKNVPGMKWELRRTKQDWWDSLCDAGHTLTADNIVIHRQSSSSRDVDVTSFVSFNVYAANKMSVIDELIRLVKETDCVFLQEDCTVLDSSGKLKSLGRTVAETTDSNYYYESCHFGPNFESYGVSVISKNSISCSGIVLPDSDFTRQMKRDGEVKGTRSFILAQIGELKIANVHLASAGAFSDSVEHLRLMAEQNPDIIVGDMNTLPGATMLIPNGRECCVSDSASFEEWLDGAGYISDNSDGTHKTLQCKLDWVVHKKPLSVQTEVRPSLGSDHEILVSTINATIK